MLGSSKEHANFQLKCVKTARHGTSLLVDWSSVVPRAFEGSNVKMLMSLRLEELTGVMLDIQFFLDSRRVERQTVTNRHAATSQKTSVVTKERHVSTHI